LGRAQIKLDECVSWAVAGGSRPFYWSVASLMDAFYSWSKFPLNVLKS